MLALAQSDTVVQCISLPHVEGELCLAWIGNYTTRKKNSKLIDVYFYLNYLGSNITCRN